MNSSLYLASYLISCLLISMFAGKKALYYFLILTLLGVIFFRWNKYSISFQTPEIYQDVSTTHVSSSGQIHGGGGGAF